VKAAAAAAAASTTRMILTQLGTAPFLKKQTQRREGGWRREESITMAKKVPIAIIMNKG
jgi:hypothetical protein